MTGVEYPSDLPHHDATLRELEGNHDEMMRQAIGLSMEASDFLMSKLARCIIERAECKVVDAMAQLARVDPTDTKEIIRLQVIVGQYDHYDVTLRTLIEDGDQAYQVFLQREE